MKLLVTGGAGYVGATVARMARDAGHQVVIVDDLSRNDDRQVPSGVVFARLRVHDIADVLTAEAGFDAVLHFAGLIAAGESMAHPEWHWDNNTRASLALLDAMRAAEVGKLVFSSTAAVYGEPTELPLTETSPTNPVNTYGDTKLAVDRAIASYTRTGALGATSLRYFNVAGAHACDDGIMIGERHDPETHLIPLALDAALGHRDKLSLFGDDYPTADGTCVRDYIHITDLARAHLLALDAIEPGEHNIYNLGNGIGFSNLQVVQAVREVTGAQFDVENAPRRPGDPATLYASSDLAHSELGWKPEKPDIADIVADAWAFHRTHR
ncbi:UDP-glucose 4-epimerase GalE [Nocardia speluncae]|uniref:UDP-glucose 4-epimerase n=1 Tax=Nocardia speluncae TaxID=419477 RepID=A0A846XJM6_9NOCA|nr:MULTISPECIES: UDP-glucose 4-epimerase GalE [Nocardia]NKY34860.1 UDP-glucose 4-epimerase GalE [Nocardia speluncae]